MVSKRKILITTGDPDGIGWEVTRKALARLGPQPNVQFIFFRHALGEKASLKGKFKIVRVQSLDEAQMVPFRSNLAVEILNSEAPAKWVEQAAKACRDGRFQALVTAPMSKTSVLATGLKDIGHTEILARITGCQDLFMGFWGTRFSVVLATGHIPLAEVRSKLTRDLVVKALSAAATLKHLQPRPKQKQPIAVVGVNPHAGEQGLIGTDESILIDAIKLCVREVGPIEGPLVPDAAFLPQNRSRYSVYVTPYHDQGLIPFKLLHGFGGGVHLTLGLPFVRTSVDHGTAKDLFGKGKANAGSMKDAIMAAVRLTREG